MTTAPEHDLTSEVAALQRLPEDEQAPEVLEPNCATTGITANAVSRPADARPDDAPDANESQTDPSS